MEATKDHKEMIEDTEAQREKSSQISSQDDNYVPSEEEKRLLKKQDMRILPLCATIYLLCFIDRSNIGNAKVLNAATKNDLLSETHMTTLQYTIALMVFLVAYASFEVPSNYFLKKFSPSKWIAFLMFSWGACTIGLGGTKSYASITTVRFLLGMFEAGLFPGLVYYLTFWYKTSERSFRVALILASATLGGAFGGALAFGIGHMNQVHGLSAWRWLFIIEGIPSCLSAFLVWFFFPDYPETVHWLTPEEKALAAERLKHEGSKSHGGNLTWPDAKATLTDWRLYAHYAIYFMVSLPFSSLSLFTPSIVAGLGYSGLKAQLMTVPPYAVAYVFTLSVSYAADHFNARGIWTAFSALVGAAGFLGSALLPPTSYTSRYGCLILATAGSFGTVPPLNGWLSSNMFATASTGLAIAIMVSIGAPGQISGLWIYKANEVLKGYPTGHYTNAAMLFLCAACCLLLRFYYIYLNKKIVSRDPTVRRLFAY